ncbi:hypothetical protein P3S67_019920 [Capsicum chacoense]
MATNSEATVPGSPAPLHCLPTSANNSQLEVAFTFSNKLVVLILLLPYANATLPGPKSKKHFLLIHRACHGAWSWYKIVALMRSSGHNVTAIDLGASGINSKQVLDVQHLSDYFSPLIEFMASLPADEKVILVGHDYGGFAISKAMESFPKKILVAVFLTALMPGPTLGATTVYNEGFCAGHFASKAVKYLPCGRLFKGDSSFKKKWMIKNNPPDEVEEIRGSGHMVMMSKPLQIFTKLLGIAARYN